MQMRSDVPVGSFLSGGIDSSLVTALASHNTPQNMSTFHLHWNGIDGKYDESSHAKLVSERYETDHYVKDINDDTLIQLIPKLVWHLEEPFADGAFVFTYALAQKAAEHVKVILSGAGGDELFGGYEHYNSSPNIQSIISNIMLQQKPLKTFQHRSIKNVCQIKKIFPWYENSKYHHKMEIIYSDNYSKNKTNSKMLHDIKKLYK